MAGRVRWQWVAYLAASVSTAGALALAAAGPGYQMGWWSLGTALQQMLRWGAYAGLAGALLGLAGLVLNSPRAAGRAFIVAGAALMLGAIVAGIPWQWQRTVRRVPPIHDVTTDTVTPPVFEAVVPLREGANPLTYTDAKAEAQRAGYPDLGPLVLAAPPDEVYARALALVRARGWDVAAEDARERRIEATATTRWFRFKDDVLVRVAALPDGGSRVDMRSVSRIGRSDAGTNARRIREFLGDLAR